MAVIASQPNLGSNAFLSVLGSASVSSSTAYSVGFLFRCDKSQEPAVTQNQRAQKPNTNPKTDSTREYGKVKEDVRAEWKG